MGRPDLPPLLLALVLSIYLLIFGTVCALFPGWIQSRMLRYRALYDWSTLGFQYYWIGSTWHRRYVRVAGMLVVVVGISGLAFLAEIQRVANVALVALTVIVFGLLGLLFLTVRPRDDPGGERHAVGRGDVAVGAALKACQGLVSNVWPLPELARPCLGIDLTSGVDAIPVLVGEERDPLKPSFVLGGVTWLETHSLQGTDIVLDATPVRRSSGPKGTPRIQHLGDDVGTLGPRLPPAGRVVDGPCDTVVGRVRGAGQRKVFGKQVRAIRAQLGIHRVVAQMNPCPLPQSSQALAASRRFVASAAGSWPVMACSAMNQ